MPITADILRKYKNRYFLETGTYLGDGVAAALEAGFHRIASIEVSEELYGLTSQKLKDKENVSLFLGSSDLLLSDIIKKIRKPITFWLDAHYSGGNTGKGPSRCPVLTELEIIGRHPIKNHTILIDDIRLFGKNYLLHEDMKNYTEQERRDYLFEEVPIETIQALIKRINPAYEFRLEDGHVPGDILAASVERKIKWCRPLNRILSVKRFLRVMGNKP